MFIHTFYLYMGGVERVKVTRLLFSLYIVSNTKSEWCYNYLK